MKNLKTIIVAVSALAFGLAGCDKDRNLMMSEADQAALLGMNESYESAVAANENVEKSILSGDSLRIHMYDSIFHYCHRSFEQHHSTYSHRGPYDDHQHNGQSLHQMNGMMDNHHASKNGHHVFDHELMDKLLHDHELTVH